MSPVRAAARLVPALLLSGLVVALPAGTATAAACPPGVAETTGDNPSYAAISGLLEAAAARYDVPPQLLKSIAYQEGYDTSDGRRWAQFDVEDRTVIVTGTCDVGIMQVNVLRDDVDDLRAASDVAYNIDRGAFILAEKWTFDAADDPAGVPPDDRSLIENWYWSTCAYNGCTGESTSYADEVVRRAVDPFRWAGLAHEHMPPVGWTRPQDADPSYDFPAGFAARKDNGGEFVFYDSTGAVAKTVPAAVHDWRTAPRISYPAGMFGPDGPSVTCRVPGFVSCADWRLDPGKGIAGRSHWTGAWSGETAKVTWAPVAWSGDGVHRIDAYIPSIGPDDAASTRPKGPATYVVTHAAGTTSVVVDQAGFDDVWVTIGAFRLNGASKVVLSDHGTAGTRVVADALRLVRPTSIVATTSPASVRYGGTSYIRGTLYKGNPAEARLPGHIVRFYSRRGGGTPWAYLGARRSDSNGNFAFPVKPAAYTEYHARYDGAGGYLASISGLSRVSVAQAVTARINTASMPLGRTATITASVAPSHAGGYVHLQRLVSGTWRDVVIYRLSSTSGVTFTSRPRARGTYYFRVYRPADRDHLAGASGTLTLRVY